MSPPFNTDDLCKQPFRITFPMMHSCCQNNASPFQVKGELGQPSGGGIYFPFRTIILLSVVESLVSDECFLVRADEFFLDGSGLKCVVRA